MAGHKTGYTNPPQLSVVVVPPCQYALGVLSDSYGLIRTRPSAATCHAARCRSSREPTPPREKEADLSSPPQNSLPRTLLTDFPPFHPPAIVLEDGVTTPGVCRCNDCNDHTSPVALPVLIFCLPAIPCGGRRVAGSIPKGGEIVPR